MFVEQLNPVPGLAILRVGFAANGKFCSSLRHQIALIGAIQIMLRGDRFLRSRFRHYHNRTDGTPLFLGRQKLVIPQHRHPGFLRILLEQIFSHVWLKCPLFQPPVMLANAPVKVSCEARNGEFIPNVGCSQAPR